MTASSSRPLSIALWIAQVLVAVPFCIFGFMKLTEPIPALFAMMAWTSQTPEAFVRTSGAIDIAGGIGILLPALTRIQPRLTVLAALGCTVLQVCAIVFHVSRGEFSALPINAVLLPLSAFVLWGRSKKVPITSRN